jgi:sugar phosphate isomerase/epimerase
MKAHIVHVHIKDGTKESSSQKTTMLGQGQVDTRWVVEKLEGIGYQGHYTLEYEVETVPAEAGLRQWYDTFRRLVGV